MRGESRSTSAEPQRLHIWRRRRRRGPPDFNLQTLEDAGGDKRPRAIPPRRPLILKQNLAPVELIGKPTRRRTVVSRRDACDCCLSLVADESERRGVAGAVFRISGELHQRELKGR